MKTVSAMIIQKCRLTFDLIIPSEFSLITILHQTVYSRSLRDKMPARNAVITASVLLLTFNLEKISAR